MMETETLSFWINLYDSIEADEPGRSFVAHYSVQHCGLGHLKETKQKKKVKKIVRKKIVRKKDCKKKDCKEKSIFRINKIG